MQHFGSWGKGETNYISTERRNWGAFYWYIYIYPSASSFRFKFLCHGDFGPTRGIRRFGRHPASGVGPAEAPTVFVTGGGWQNLPTKPGGFIYLVNFQKETDVSKNRCRTHVDTGLIL